MAGQKKMHLHLGCTLHLRDTRMGAYRISRTPGELTLMIMCQMCIKRAPCMYPYVRDNVAYESHPSIWSKRTGTGSTLQVNASSACSEIVHLALICDIQMHSNPHPTAPLISGLKIPCNLYLYVIRLDLYDNRQKPSLRCFVSHYARHVSQHPSPVYTYVLFPDALTPARSLSLQTAGKPLACNPVPSTSTTATDPDHFPSTTTQTAPPPNSHSSTATCI